MALALALLCATPCLGRPAGEPVYEVFQAYSIKRVPGKQIYGGKRPRKSGGVVEGTLELATKLDPMGRPRIDRDAFATCPKGEHSPEVPSLMLTLEIPGSALVPDYYQQATFLQFDDNVRTHWALLFTQPGSTFTLDLQVRCIDGRTGFPVEHSVRHLWKVAADFASLRALIDALHTHPIETSNIPLVVSERAYDELRGAVDEIERLAEGGFTASAKSAIADLQTQLMDDASSILLSTPENPAREALVVTLEYIDARL
jgi:hypothetical protein